MLLSSSYAPLPHDWSPPSWLDAPESLVEPREDPSYAQRFKVFCKQHAAMATYLAPSLFLAFPGGHLSCRIFGAGASFLTLSALGDYWGYRELQTIDCEYITKEIRKNPLVAQVLDKPCIKTALKIQHVSRHHFFIGEKDINQSTAHVVFNGDHVIIEVIENHEKQESFYNYRKAMTSGETNLSRCRDRLMALTIFEIMNVNNHQRFKQLIEKAQQGEISREDYAILTEYIEMDTSVKTTQAISWGVQHLGWNKSLFKQIECVQNNDQQIEHFKSTFWKGGHWATKEKMSHTDVYRQNWDENVGLKYYCCHLEKIGSEEFCDFLKRLSADEMPIKITMGQKEDKHSICSAIAAFFSCSDSSDNLGWLKMLDHCFNHHLPIKNTWTDETKRAFLQKIKQKHPKGENLDPDFLSTFGRLLLEVYRSMKPENLTPEEHRQLMAYQNNFTEC